MKTEAQYIALRDATSHPTARRYYHEAAHAARAYEHDIRIAADSPPASEVYDARRLDQQADQGPLSTRERWEAGADLARQRAESAEYAGDAFLGRTAITR